MAHNLPYGTEIDLTPLIQEEISKAIEALGLRSNEDLDVEVIMEEDLKLVVRVGPSDPGVLQ